MFSKITQCVQFMYTFLKLNRSILIMYINEVKFKLSKKREKCKGFGGGQHNQENICDILFSPNSPKL